MKRTAEGSICAVSITKRAKLEEPEAAVEPEAADGITRRSPKLEAADGAGISMMRARKPEKPSKKEKGAEEKSKRSKKKRAEVFSKISYHEKKMDEFLMRIEKIATKIEGLMAGDGLKKERRTKEKRAKIASKIEGLVAGDGMKKEGRAKEKRAKKPEGIVAREMVDNKVREMGDNEAGVLKKKKKVVRLSPELLEILRAKEVMGFLASEMVWPSMVTEELFSNPEDPDGKNPHHKDEIPLKERITAEFQENIEFDAHVLYQYRTKGYVEVEEEVSDEEVDEEVSDKEHDVEADGILIGKMHARKPEKPSKKEKGAEESKRSNPEKRTEESKRSSQEKRTEEKNEEPNKVGELSQDRIEDYYMGDINAEFAEEEKRTKKLQTVKLSPGRIEDFLSYEVQDYMLAEPMLTFEDCYNRQSLRLYDDRAAALYFARHTWCIETRASVIRQYRTKGSAFIQFYATDNKAE